MRTRNEGERHRGTAPQRLGHDQKTAKSRYAKVVKKKRGPGEKSKRCSPGTCALKRGKGREKCTIGSAPKNSLRPTGEKVARTRKQTKNAPTRKGSTRKWLNWGRGNPKIMQIWPNNLEKRNTPNATKYGGGGTLDQISLLGNSQKKQRGETGMAIGE